MDSFYKEDLEGRIKFIQDKYVTDRGEYRRQLQEYNIEYNKKLAITTRFLISSMTVIKQNLCHELFGHQDYYRLNVHQMEIMTVVLYKLIADFDSMVVNTIVYNTDVANWKEKSNGEYKTFDVYNADGSITRANYKGNEGFFNPANTELHQHYYNKLFALLRDIETDILRKDESIIDELKREFGGVGEFLHSTLGSVKTGFENVPGYLGSAMHGAQNYGSSLLTGAQNYGSSLLTGAQNYGSSLLTGAQNYGRSALTGGRSAWNTVANVVNENVHPIRQGGDPRLAYTGPRPQESAIAAAGGGGMMVESTPQGFENLVEYNPNYVPAGWQPQQPPPQISNSNSNSNRSANINSNALLGFSRQNFAQGPINSQPRIQMGSPGFLGTADFSRRPPSIPLTAANINNMYPKEKLDKTPTPSEVASLQNYNARMDISNRGGSKTRKPKRNKKTLRRNPRKLMSRRQKYSRRK